MKILLVNTHHKMNGGTERYYFELGKILKSKGHSVAYFSMEDVGNVKTKWSKYFVSNVDPSKRGPKQFLIKIPRIFYSIEAKVKIGKLLDDFKPDIVHLNNIYYHITSSILSEMDIRKIPVIQTVHDYQIISPNVIMYHDGAVCEVSKKHDYYKSILHKCNDNSYIGSTIMAIINYVQHFQNLYFKRINLFITPSKFMKSKLTEYGIDKNKIVHINNFINQNETGNNHYTGERYILYSGRLTEAKGIRDVIRLAIKFPFINIKVAGNYDNPNDKEFVLNQIQINNITNIKIVGFKKRLSLKRLIQNASFVLVPSKWYENQPYSILEAYINGKAVIASNLGGIPEIVKEGETGYLFNPNRKHDFEDKVLHLWNNKRLSINMGRKAKNFAKEHFDAVNHYKLLINVYSKIIKLYEKQKI